MHPTAKSLLDKKVTTTDGSFPVTELFYSPDDWSVRYLLIDTGGWFRSDEVLASMDRVSWDETDGWRLNMTRDELDDAPVIDTLDPDVVNLPPLVVGPFGYTFSPLAMAASVGVTTDAPDQASTDAGPDGNVSRDGRGRIMRMERVTRFLGTEAFTDSGPQGQVSDIQMSDELKLTHVILDRGGKLPLRNLRRIADQGHALFD